MSIYKVGDKVRVVSKIPENEPPSWVPPMNGLLGKEFVVEGISGGSGGYVRGLGRANWDWNDKWLEKVEEKPKYEWTKEKLEKEFPIGCEVKVIDESPKEKHWTGADFNIRRSHCGKTVKVVEYSTWRPMGSNASIDILILDCCPYAWVPDWIEKVEPKFKVGDTVRIVDTAKERYRGKLGTIKSISYGGHLTMEEFGEWSFNPGQEKVDIVKEFPVGSKIRVKDSPKPGNSGVSLANEMKEYFGKVITVTGHAANCGNYDNRSGIRAQGWNWLLDWVEKVEESKVEEKLKPEFKVGDRVRIISKPPENKEEYPIWVSVSMDVYCGRECTIKHVGNTPGQHPYVRFKEWGFSWNPKWLEKIEPFKSAYDGPGTLSITECFPIGRKVRVTENLENELERVGWLKTHVDYAGQIAVIRGYDQSKSPYTGLPIIGKLDVDDSWTVYPDWLEADLDNQKFSKFKVGDTVRVISNPPENKEETEDSLMWAMGMKEFCGEEFVVRDVTQPVCKKKCLGYHYKLNSKLTPDKSRHWQWSEEWLEEVLKPKPEPKFKVGDKVRIISKPPNRSMGPVWVPSMDERCGKECTIKGRNEHGGYYMEEFGMAWNEKWIETKFKVGDTVRTGVGIWPEIDGLIGTVETAKIGGYTLKEAVFTGYFFGPIALEKVEEKGIHTSQSGHRIEMAVKAPKFNVGDSVRVNYPKMEHHGKLGTISAINEYGNFNLKEFPGWTFVPEWLEFPKTVMRWKTWKEFEYVIAGDTESPDNGSPIVGDTVRVIGQPYNSRDLKYPRCGTICTISQISKNLEIILKGYPGCTFRSNSIEKIEPKSSLDWLKRIFVG